MKHLGWMLLALIVGLVVAEYFFAPMHHPVFPWHHAGYMAGIGLGACVVVTVLTKFVGKRFLQRPEDYDER